MEVQVLPTEVVIPRNASLIEIKDSYGPLAEEISCGLEGCRTPHKRGFVVLFCDSGGAASGIGVIGHVCGRSAFGTSWREAERAYDAIVRAAEMDAARERFLVRAGRILPELKGALPRLKTLDATRKVLDRNAIAVMRICADAVKSSHGGIRVDRGGQQVILHRLKGESFWVDGNNALPRAQDLDMEATRFLEYLSSPAATKKEVERRLGHLTDIEHRWGLASKAMEAAESALHPSHLEQVFAAVDLIGQRTRYLQRNVRIRGTILEVRKWDALSESTHERWEPAVDLG